MDVTEADREKAAELLRGGYRQEHIAAALAEEREKARAPFLALAERFSWDTFPVPDWTGKQVAEAIRCADGETT